MVDQLIQALINPNIMHQCSMQDALRYCEEIIQNWDKLDQTNSDTYSEEYFTKLKNGTLERRKNSFNIEDCFRVGFN